MPSECKRWMIAAARSFAAAINNEPEPIRPRGHPGSCPSQADRDQLEYNSAW